jgi:glycerol-3-phosphate acyltransferase PlsY
LATEFPHVFFWLALAFLLGSIPFAVWLGCLAGVDARWVGDRNPVSMNA